MRRSNGKLSKNLTCTQIRWTQRQRSGREGQHGAVYHSGRVLEVFGYMQIHGRQKAAIDAGLLVLENGGFAL
jgi:hypothetical protein